MLERRTTACPGNLLALLAIISGFMGRLRLYWSRCRARRESPSFARNIVPPQDPPALAEALATLLDEKWLCERFGREARRTAAERFDVSRMLDCMEGAFRHLVRAA